MDGGFEVIVSGQRKGTGSSRETAAQARSGAGIQLVIAASFAPIHERNNINLGQLMGDHAAARAPAGRRGDPARGVHRPATTRSRALILETGGLFPFARALAARRGHASPPPDTRDAADDDGREDPRRAPASAAAAGVREARRRCAWCRSTAATATSSRPRRCTTSSRRSTAPTTRSSNPSKFAVFEDHLLYADGVQAHGARSPPKIETLRDLQREFQRHTGVRDYSARDGVSPGICHQVARERVRRSRRLHPGHRQPHLHGRRQQRADLGRRRDRVRGADPLRASRSSRCPSRSASSSTGELGAGVHGQGRDAAHPRSTYAKPRGDAQPRDGVRRPGARVAVDGRARDALPTWRPSARRASRHLRGRRRDARLARRAARRTRTVEALRARAAWRPTPAPSYDGGVHTIDLARDRSRWSRSPAIPTATGDPTTAR